MSSQTRQCFHTGTTAFMWPPRLGFHTDGWVPHVSHDSAWTMRRPSSASRSAASHSESSEMGMR